jgi:hypothetical protein
VNIRLEVRAESRQYWQKALKTKACIKSRYRVDKKPTTPQILSQL